MKSFERPPRYCPHCQYRVDAAAPLPNGEQPQPPEPGDYMLCLGCGEWGIEEEGGTIREPTLDEYEEIGLNPDCRRARKAWVQVTRAAT